MLAERMITCPLFMNQAFKAAKAQQILEAFT
jgi:hypothetical protein